MEVIVSPVSLRESHKYKILDLFNKSRSTIYQHPLSLILARSLSVSTTVKSKRIGQQKLGAGVIFLRRNSQTAHPKSLHKVISEGGEYDSNTMRRGIVGYCRRRSRHLIVTSDGLQVDGCHCNMTINSSFDTNHELFTVTEWCIESLTSSYLLSSTIHTSHAFSVD
jgi:hypothetical protein